MKELTRKEKASFYRTESLNKFVCLHTLRLEFRGEFAGNETR